MGQGQNRERVSAHKRAELIRKSRRVRAADLYLRGYTKPEIATALGVSHMTVWRDINDWEASADEEIKQLAIGRRNRAIRKLEKLQTETWTAWEKSKGTTEKISTRVYKNKEGEEVEDVTRTVEGTPGDPKYLGEMVKLLRLQSDLEGLTKEEIGVNIQNTGQIVLEIPDNGRDSGLVIDEPS